MKILNVNDVCNPYLGGTNERTYQMSRALLRVGLDISVLATDKDLTSIEVDGFPSTRLIALHCVNKRFCIPSPSLFRIFDAVGNADIVHLMGHWSLLNALVYHVARLLNRPYVVCPAGALGIFGRSGTMKRVFNRFVGLSMIRNASAWIATSELEKAEFAIYGVPRSSIIVIPNGVEPDDFKKTDDSGFRGRFKLGQDPFLLFLGRLNHIKGPDLLLEAFARVQDAFPCYQLVFAGPDEGLKNKLESMAANLGVSRRTHFVGVLDRQEKANALHAARLIVVPSRKEVMSMVALEAAMVGRPVLVTVPCGCLDDVRTSDGGLVVSATADGLAGGLISLLHKQNTLADRGKRWRDHCISRFTWNTLTGRYLDLYGRILNDPAQSQLHSIP